MQLSSLIYAKGSFLIKTWQYCPTCWKMLFLRQNISTHCSHPRKEREESQLKFFFSWGRKWICNFLFTSEFLTMNCDCGICSLNATRTWQSNWSSLVGPFGGSSPHDGATGSSGGRDLFIKPVFLTCSVKQTVPSQSCSFSEGSNFLWEFSEICRLNRAVYLPITLCPVL